MTGAQIKEWLEMSAGQFNQIDPNSKEPQQLINSSYRSYNYDVIDGLTYKFDWHNLTNTIAKVSWLTQTLAVFVTWLIKVNLLIWIRLSLSWLTTIVRLVTSLVLKMLQKKRLLNLENRQAIIDYIVSEKTINPSADGNWSFVPNITNADIRFASSDNARAHLLVRMPLVM